MSQNSNFRLPRGHRFQPKFDLTLLAPNHGGEPLGSILGPMGSHWGQKMGQNRKKLECHNIRIFDYPTVIDFGQNWTLRLWRQITVGPLPRVHLVANGVPLGPKNGSKPLKKNMHQNSNFLLVAPLAPSWGHWSPIGAKKWVKTVKNHHAPKIEFSTTPLTSISAKIGLYGYGVKSRWGPPKVHLVANGVPLGPKNGSKP